MTVCVCVCVNYYDCGLCVQLRITLMTDIPVQVDGEPWVQPAGQVVVLRSALKVRHTVGQSLSHRDTVGQSLSHCDTRSVTFTP